MSTVMASAMNIRADSAQFGWYKDVALSVCVFVLVVVGLSAFFEPPTSILVQHRTAFLVGVAVFAAGCVLLASSRLLVLGAALSIMLLRSVVAIAFGPRVGLPIFVAIASVSAVLLYVLLRSQREPVVRYDSDRSSWAIGILAAAAGFGVAALLLRFLTIAIRHSW